jgi:hypothetical protein
VPVPIHPEITPASDPTIRLPSGHPVKPGPLARTSPEAVLLVGAVLSLGSCALLALAEAVAAAGIAGLALGAVALYVVAVGLIQAVLRRGGGLF